MCFRNYGLQIFKKSPFRGLLRKQHVRDDNWLGSGQMCHVTAWFFDYVTKINVMAKAKAETRIKAKTQSIIQTITKGFEQVFIDYRYSRFV